MDIKASLVNLVEKGLRTGSVYVFSYHGKLQEVMQILHDASVEVPFVMPENVYNISRVCEKHNMSFGELVLRSQKEGKELLSKSLPCVSFLPYEPEEQIWPRQLPRLRKRLGNHLSHPQNGHEKISRSSQRPFRLRRTTGVCQMLGTRTRDNRQFTSDWRRALAREINRRFGISAVALPRSRIF